MSNVKHRMARSQIQILLDEIGPGRTSLSPTAVGLVTQLQADLAKFEQTWSEMGMRNLLADLVRGVDKLYKILPEKQKPICINVSLNLKKMMAGHAPGRGRYNNALCFGYRVKTAGDNYQGDVADWNDMKTRCDDMIRAIQNAYALADAQGGHNSDPKMLKIFMAPEFFFRGRNGAYDLALVTGTNQQKVDKTSPVIPRREGLIDLMRAEISKPVYKDWLFVLGTAIAATRISSTVCKICSGETKWVKDPTRPGKTKAVCKANPAHAGTKEEAVGAQIDNVAIVMKEGTTYTVTKELVSHIDFVAQSSPRVTDVVRLNSEVLPVHSYAQVSGYNSADHVPSKFQDERMGGSIFTVDGITFGLEVCLDHGAKPSSGSSGRLEHAANIQIQLIPSGGMSIGSMSTVSGGIVFNVDGKTPHVQVVAGGPKADIRYDLVNNGNEFQLAYPRKVAFENIGSVDRLEGAKPLNKWKFLPAAPKVASGPSGSVLMYGPYDIPVI